MSTIKENILYSKRPIPEEDEEKKNKPFIDLILDVVRKDLATKGDRLWMTDVELKKSVHLKDIEVLAGNARDILQQAGLKKDQVVQIVMANNADYFWPIFGAWLLGGVVSLSDPGLHHDVLKKQLDDGQAKIIVCSQYVKEKVKLANKEHHAKVFVIEHEQWQVRQQMNSILKAPEDVNVDDTTIIFWSSGTTGMPKGICHSHRFMKGSLNDTAFPDCTLMQTTCMFHAGGFILPFDGGIHNKLPIAFMNPNKTITAHDLFEQIFAHQPSVLICGSHHVVQMAGTPTDHILYSVKIVAPLGASVQDGIIEQLNERFPKMLPAILGFYGMTEVGTICKSMVPTQLGELAAGCQVKIVDPLTGELLGPNCVGEILVKTPTVMKEYLNNPEENEHFFAEDGFVRTGDLGYYDEHGVLYYKDRLKHLIKYQNCHVNPCEIEAVVISHPDVIDVGVYGRPEPTVQELVSAVVVKKPESSLTDDHLIQFVNDKLESSKHIRGGIKFVDIIPRNPQGKIIKRLLN